MIIKKVFLLIIFFSIPKVFCLSSDNDSLSVHFKGDAQVEIGNHYMGIEMHHSFPAVQRISFYYPAANSIDLSNDYWKRDSTFVSALGLKTGNNQIEWLNSERFRFDLTPYRVVFYKKKKYVEINIRYEFCKNKPAMIVTYQIKNTGNKTDSFEFYTDLETTLKTSHSYKIKDKAWTEYSGKDNAIYTNFDDPETMNAQVFVGNAGEKPVKFSCKSNLHSIPVQNNSWWKSDDLNLKNDLLSKENPGIPAARFLYKKKLAPNEKMQVVQIIGACKQSEGKGIVDHLLKNYKSEINLYEQYIKEEINKSGFVTGDKAIDHTIKWAKAILAVNQHYIDGRIEPMPCPAEYNFYFTHDVLLTDLAAVNFDLTRVKQDLEFIVEHANKDNIIPHAYYWRDTSFVTEFAEPDNWNNFWFVIVSSSYLKHSSDTSLIRKIYPYITKSLEQTLINKKNNIMWAYRPDWWDIGHIYGPRAYMTILAIKAIREYVYTSSVLNENIDKLKDYEDMTDKMQKQLNEKLWKENYKYLMNYYEDNKLDPHYYIGSLLAPHFDLLNTEKTKELISTAKQKLLDPRLGIYTVFPMDFKKLIGYMKFQGNEAGDKFLYLNGGIWSHGSAWYALDLMKLGKKKEALEFIKKVMTISGLINSPNGQPAMYEVRNGNFNNPKVYGKIDKPQFMWAAGWYLYCLYHLYGIEENNWNISFDPFTGDSKQQGEYHYQLAANGRNFNVSVKGEGNYINSISIDGKNSNTLVIPGNMSNAKNIELTLGKVVNPYLKNTNSILEDISFDKEAGTMTLNLKAYKSHNNNIEIISPAEPKTILLNNKEIGEGLKVEKHEDIYLILIDFIQRDVVVFSLY
ncbi:MAG: amylo-alpha-1,6-glucosidase [Ignavibacteriaceae bacterium]